MRFILEQGFTIKLGMDEAHQKWMKENEERLTKSYPEGTRYLGTFSVVYSSEKQAGFYRSLVELDSYGALDRLAEAAKSESSEFGRLQREWAAFGDYDLNAPWSNSLLKAVVDATIWDPPTG